MAEIDWNLVLKRGYRSITTNKNRVIPVILLLVVGIAGGSLIVSINQAQYQTSVEAWEVSNLADIWINTSLVPVSDLEDLVGLFSEFILEYDYRLVIPFQLEFEAENSTGWAVGLDWDNKIPVNKILYQSEPLLRSQITNRYGFFLERQFALSNDMDIQQPVTMYIRGTHLSLQSNLLGFDPSFTYFPTTEKYWLPAFGSLPVAFFDRIFLGELFGNSAFANQIVLKLGWVDTARFQDIMKQKLFDNPIARYVISIIPREEYPAYQFATEDYETDTQLGYMMSAVLFVVALMVLYVTAEQQVEQEKKQIGALRAIGASRAEIFGSYIIFATLIGAIGLILSIPFTFLLGQLLVTWAKDILANPDLQFSMNFQTVMIFGVSAFVMGFLAIVISAYRASKVTPMTAIRPEAEYYIKTPLIERILAFFRVKLGPESKFILRRFFGRKVRGIFMGLGFALVMMLFVFTFALSNSMTALSEVQFNEYENWDVAATLTDYKHVDVIDQAISDIAFLNAIEPAISDYIGIIDSKREIMFVGLWGYLQRPTMHTFGLREGYASLDGFSTIISSNLVGELDVGMGDVIQVQTREGKDQALKIVGISSELVQTSIVTSLEMAGRLTGNIDKANAILCTSPKPTELAKALEKHELVYSVQIKTDIQEDFAILRELADVMINILLVIIGLMGILISSALIALDVNDKADDFGIMIAVGTRKSELVWMQISQSVVLVAICGPLGLLFGYQLTIAFLDWMAVNFVSMPFSYPPSQMVISFILFIITILAGNILPLRRVFKMNIADLTREKVIG